MDRSDIICLLTPTSLKTPQGVTVTTYEERVVFCRVRSISRSEFYDAGRNGLNPDFEFIVFAGDYNGERLARYKGNTYAIYRTYYGKNDNLELYVQREGGVNGK